MDLGLTAKRALVFGASAGLGKAIATRLAEEGSEVVIAGRDRTRLSRTAHEIGAGGFVCGDLAQAGEAERQVSEALGMLGGLDILVVNTGGAGAGPIGQSTAAARERAYRSVLAPALDASLAAIPHLEESSAGRLVYITARSVVEASTDLALSSVFRSGVAAAARSLALELAPRVLVNVVVPGQFDTGGYHGFRSWLAEHDGVSESAVDAGQIGRIPLGRLGRADELADVVAFLVSERASYVTGSVIRVDGGAVSGFH